MTALAASCWRGVAVRNLPQRLIQWFLVERDFHARFHVGDCLKLVWLTEWKQIRLEDFRKQRQTEGCQEQEEPVRAITIWGGDLLSATIYRCHLGNDVFGSIEVHDHLPYRLEVALQGCVRKTGELEGKANNKAWKYLLEWNDFCWFLRFRFFLLPNFTLC